MARPVIVRVGALRPLYVAVTLQEPIGWDVVTIWQVGSGLPSRLATYAREDSGVAVDSVCWSPTLGKLLVGATIWRDPKFPDTSGPPSSSRIILSCTPGAQSLEVFKDSYIHSIDHYDPVSAMMEWNGHLYAVHSGQDQEPAYVARMALDDPENTFEIVLEVYNFNYNLGEGGIGLVGDRLYVAFGEALAWSTTGNLGEWAVTNMYDSPYQLTEMAGAKTDPASGHMFFGAMSSNLKNRDIWRIGPEGPVQEYTEYVDGQNDWGFVSIAVGGGAPEAIMWMPYNQAEHPIYGQSYGLTGVFRRSPDGTWAVEDLVDLRTLVSGGNRTWPSVLVNNGAVYFRGKLHVLVDAFYWVWDDEEHTSYTRHDARALVRRNAVGDWELVHEWEPTDSNWMYHYGGAAMLVV
jgi:hypothetical protein